ncbi:MAG: type II toxin-antitoxin system HicB family antitoxin [Candidatus Marinimicrobia bacterium]|nr:type II toxin-antitoxin system HicB family antitoxin [Candidatus Neomarinimicrobiota bacterium]
MVRPSIKILIEEGEHGYYACCPGLPGCQSQGSTYEDAMENINEAIDLYLETLTHA